MDIIDGEIIKQEYDMDVSEHLFTYSEEEKQNNEINSNNSKLLLNIKYLVIPIFVFRIGLTGNEAILYAFVYNWISNGDKRFYFTNEQLAELFNISETSISNILKSLKSKKLINIVYKMKTGGGRIKFISLQNQESLYSKVKKVDFHENQESLCSKIKKVDGSNISISNDNISNNNIDVFSKKKQKFIKPTLEELKEFIKQNNINIDAEYFYYLYEGVGWVAGRTPIKNWQAKVRSWARRDFNSQKNNSNTNTNNNSKYKNDTDFQTSFEIGLQKHKDAQHAEYVASFQELLKDPQAFQNKYNYRNIDILDIYHNCKPDFGYLPPENFTKIEEFVANIKKMEKLNMEELNMGELNAK